MTIEKFLKIIHENNIPINAILQSDSGWECDPTDMDRIYYNRNENLLIFTQEIDTKYISDRNFKKIY